MIRALAFLATVLLVQLAHDASAERMVPVGRMQRDYADDSRQNWHGTGPRPLDATVWYPAVAGTPQTERTVNIWRFGSSRLDAPILDGGPRPLVLVSHGAGGTVSQMSWLAGQLVQEGFIVAGVNHHGNTAVEETEYVHGFVLPTERAFDLSVLLDLLLADPVIGVHIDTGRVGAAGFSFGGYTVLAAGGVTLDYEAWWDHCRLEPMDAMCTVPPEADFTLEDVDALRGHDAQFNAAMERGAAGARDERIRAVYAIAPALLTRADLTALAVPAAVTLARHDDQVPLGETLAALEAVPEVDISIAEARHYTYLAPCTTLGRWFAGDVCRDPRGVNRGDTHAEAAARVRAFLAEHLATD